MSDSDRTSSGVQRILILGGGFAGLAAARELESRLGADPGVEITLVNRDNFFLFTPMLHEVAASDLDLSHIVNPLRKLLRRTRLFVGTVESISLEERRVSVAHGDGHHHHELGYDHLVLALGSVTSFFGLSGVAERAWTMKSLGDAVALRNRLIRLLEEADVEAASAERTALLTVVVAGGGFAGIETAAAIRDFMGAALPYYPNLSAEDVQLVIVHAGPVLLPELAPSLGHYARDVLAGRGVTVRLGARVLSADAAGVTLADRTRIPARTLVWTAGNAASPTLRSAPCVGADGRVLVDANLAVPGWPGVWAAGDCARVPDSLSGGHCPPTAQHALRQGRVLARNIVAALQGGPLRPFRYQPPGQLAAVGRRSGVAQLGPFRFSGFPAWWLWRTIYLSKLPRLEKKLRVALDWTLDLLFSKDLVQFTTGRSPAAPTDEHPAEGGVLAALPHRKRATA